MNAIRAGRLFNTGIYLTQAVSIQKNNQAQTGVNIKKNGAVKTVKNNCGSTQIILKLPSALCPRLSIDSSTTPQ